MKEPTKKEMQELVEFERNIHGTLYVADVKASINGSVWGNVLGGVNGSIYGGVEGTVFGTISGQQWQFVETPKEKAIRLIREGKSEEAIDVLEISGVCGD